MKNTFSIDEHRHYLFTPRNLTQMLFGLFRYEIEENETLSEVVVYELSKIFKDRLVDTEEDLKFDNLLQGLVR